MFASLPLLPNPEPGSPDFVVTSPFGAPRSDGPHQGVDLATRNARGVPVVGLPVLAVDAGEVRSVGYGTRGGNQLWLDLDRGGAVLYSHLQAEDLPHAGERFRAGEVIAFAGATGKVSGPHLHLEYWPTPGGPVDPVPFFPSSSSGGGVVALGLFAALALLIGWRA